MNHSFTTILFFVFSTLTLAQTHVWTGNGGDNDWFNPGNWDANTVPDATSEVIIAMGMSVIISASTASSSTIEISGGAEIILMNNLMVGTSIGLSNDSSFHMTAGTIQGGAFQNNGLFILSGSEDKAFNGVQFTNNGILEITQSGVIDLENETIINNSQSGEIRIESTGGLIQDSIGATLNNYGYIVKINEGMGGAYYMIFDMNNHGVIEAQQDQDFLFLTIAADFHNYSDGVLTGAGAFDITANFFNEGTVRPGSDGVGILEVVNNFNMIGNSVLEVDIHGAELGEYDVLDVFGGPNLEGRIVVQPQLSADDIGSQFTILTTNFEIGSCNIENYAEGTNGFDTFLFDVYCNSNDITLELYGILLGTEGFGKETAWGIFPNPSQEAITVQLEDLSDVEGPILIRIFNQLGQQIFMDEVIPQRSWNIDLSSIANGVYFIELKNARASFKTQKLIKI